VRQLTDAECRAIVEGAEELVVVYGLDGAVRYVNERVPQSMGGGATDDVGHNLVEHVHPDELERVLTAAKATGRARFEGGT
jgi:PAS domain-containing protein